MKMLRGMGGGLAVALAVAVFATACRPKTAGSLPTPEQVLSYYDYSGGLEAEIDGNVAVLKVTQSPEQLRRGGVLWAKVGPYIFLFTEETEQLLDDFDGLGAVRVTTFVRGNEVASALLAYDELSDIQWRRALNIAGKARRDGSHQMTLLEDLVRWGESHTEFTYNEKFTKR